MSKIHYLRYDEKFKRDIVDLLEPYWEGLKDRSKRREVFEWKYEKNPYLEYPSVYLALDGEKVVGHRGFVLREFCYKGESFLVATPADAFVHPEYRRQGIFSKLTDLAIEELSGQERLYFLLSLSSNKKSTAGNIKAGFTPVGERKSIHMPFLMNFARNKASSWLGRTGEKQFLKEKKSNVEIEISKELKSGDISDLMQNFTKEEKLSNVRDEKFYQWRFRECPYNNLYYSYCFENDKLVSYLCLKRDFIKKIFHCEVFSLLEFGYTDPSRFNYLINETVKVLSIPWLKVYIFTRPKEERSLLSDVGYNNWLASLLDQMNVVNSSSGLPGALIKLTGKDFPFRIGEVTNPDAWSIFHSDVF